MSDTYTPPISRFRLSEETRGQLADIAAYLAARKAKRAKGKRIKHDRSGRPAGGLAEALRVAVADYHARLPGR